MIDIILHRSEDHILPDGKLLDLLDNAMLQDISSDVSLIAVAVVVAVVAHVVLEADLGLDYGIGDMHCGPALAALHYSAQIKEEK